MGCVRRQAGTSPAAATEPTFFLPLLLGSGTDAGATNGLWNVGTAMLGGAATTLRREVQA